MRTRRQILAGGKMLAVALALGGCGFQPLYGQRSIAGGEVVDAFSRIRIVPIADRTGQLLYNQLRDRLNPQGRPGDPRYILEIVLRESATSLAYRGDETATRANLTLVAEYVLRRAPGVEGEDVVTSGRSRIVTSYDILESQYATLASIDDARARSVEALSSDIQARLAIALSAHGTT